MGAWQMSLSTTLLGGLNKDMVVISHFRIYVYKLEKLRDCRSFLEVKIYKLLLESSFRTFEKEKADFFFVPAYVKCVHMMGGLTDTEISDIYSKTSCFLFSWPSFQDGRSVLGITIFLQPYMFDVQGMLLAGGEANGRRQNRRTKCKLIQHIEGCHHPRQVDSIIPFAVSRESSVIQPLPLAKRKFLANFLGHAQGKQGWLQLIKLGKQFPQERMEMFLVHKKLWKGVIESEADADRSAEAKALIGLNVTEQYLGRVVAARNAEQAWDELEKVFRGKTTARKLQLKRELMTLK
ncbi:unnamed protein product [Sphagnum balticum]